ncbi:SGNH/GDSL hydrolase family protein [uncultured Paracoccus sp.]|uniref:SGNH/GDSL hydrolase family protein n=1 Tax=uncultured Paracoccus sp. TaxID=189685 RepID=UPI0025F7C129|nr:SGNH/GDSL hydrolase family protein [uncultured Paracoccus sp.]
MSSISDLKAEVNDVYRDTVAPGSSLPNDPAKTRIRSLMGAVLDKVEEVGASAVAGRRVFATLAERDAWTDRPVGAVAYVEAAGAAYRWSGTAWEAFEDPTIAAAARAEAAADLVGDVTSALQGAGADAFSANGMILATGVFAASEAWRATDFIGVEGDIEYRVTANANGNAYHAWYDGNRQFLSSFRGGDAVAVVTSTHVSPSAARFIRLSTRDISQSASSFAPSSGRLNIEQVVRIVGERPPVVPAAKVTYRSENVDAALDRQAASLSAVQDQLANVLNEIDLAADDLRPLFVPTSLFTLSHKTVAPAVPINITARQSDATFTVAAGQGAKLVKGGALVVHDADADRYWPFGVKAVSGDLITVHGVLPPTCSTCETMHEADTGQHLGRHGYRGLADWLIERLEKYAYRKDDGVLVFHPPACAGNTANLNDPHIYDRSSGVKLIDVVRHGGAAGGGFVAGTTNLVRACQTRSIDVSLAETPLGQFLPRFYVVQDAGVGKGVSIDVLAGGVDGFIQAYVGAARVPHSSGQFTEGRVRFEVLADGAVLYDQTFDAGVVHEVNVDFVRSQAITVRMTLADDAPTSARLGGLYIYQKSPKTPKRGFFQTGDVVAFLGDSWTQFPNAVAGETKPLRPDGSPADGMQFLSERLRQTLAAEGVAITTLNYGKGGTTSQWGRYWVDGVLEADPKPTHCVVNFAINDRNSILAPTSEAYDFSPSDMWSFQPASSGGVDGRIGSVEDWLAAMAHICQRLARAGVRPIVLMPPHTGSVSQAYSLQRDFLARLSAGFSTPV